MYHFPLPSLPSWYSIALLSALSSKCTERSEKNSLALYILETPNLLHLWLQPQTVSDAHPCPTLRIDFNKRSRLFFIWKQSEWTAGVTWVSSSLLWKSMWIFYRWVNWFTHLSRLLILKTRVDELCYYSKDFNRGRNRTSVRAFCIKQILSRQSHKALKKWLLCWNLNVLISLNVLDSKSLLCFIGLWN